jgi:serine/threonine-protein kinase
MANASAAGATAGGPAQACSARVLLGYQICMNEQCALPTYANHPVCVERRAADKANRETFTGGRN